jgi:hypothetical protein
MVKSAEQEQQLKLAIRNEIGRNPLVTVVQLQKSLEEKGFQTAQGYTLYWRYVSKLVRKLNREKARRRIPSEMGGANLFFVEDVAYQKAAIQEMARAMLFGGRATPATQFDNKFDNMAAYYGHASNVPRLFASCQ